MAYPLNVKTRLVSFGGAATVEAGIPLHIRISTESSRSLIWVENGYRLESLAALYMSAIDGQEIIFEVPTTDQNGWLDAATRQAIIVEPGEASHLYTTKLEIFTEDHELIRTYEIGPYAVPEGPGTLDADLLNPNYDPIEGTLTVYIPGPEGGLSEAGQQAAANAMQAAIDAEGYRDEAEVFSATTVELQDAAMAVVAADTGSTFFGQMGLNFALKNEIPDEVVTSEQVARIVAVKEGEPAPLLVEGDMLVRYAVPGHVYYKDFASDPAGGAAPVGMTQRLDHAATVRAFEGGTGGHVMQVEAQGGATAYSIDAADLDEHYADAEILLRWHFAGSHGASVFFNIDTATDSYERISYNVVSSAGRVRWTSRRNGANEYTPEGPTITAVAGNWYFLRARYSGGFIRGKVWADGSPEPAEWDYSREVASLTTPLQGGKHGVGSFNVFTRIDQIAHATGGKVAVMP